MQGGPGAQRLHASTQSRSERCRVEFGKADHRLERRRGACEIIEKSENGGAVFRREATRRAFEFVAQMRVQHQPQAIDAGPWPLPAQQAKVDQIGKALHPISLSAEQSCRIAQQRQKVHRIALAGNQVQRLPRQTASWRLEQRRARGVVDMDVEALELGSNATRQVSVRRNDADRLPRCKG